MLRLTFGGFEKQNDAAIACSHITASVKIENFPDRVTHIQAQKAFTSDNKLI